MYLVCNVLRVKEVRFITYEDTIKTLHSTLILIKIANYVVRCTSYDIMTLIFNNNKLNIISLYVLTS